ncbi:MAG TPA: zinc ribbon domain-containing protein [Solirubrobacterales bacterium]
MPVYEYECKRCGERFEELVREESASPPCPKCGAVEVRRVISLVSPPGRQPRGPRVRDSESRRREREARRAAGE